MQTASVAGASGGGMGWRPIRKISRAPGVSPRIRSQNNNGPPIQAMKTAESLHWNERLFLDAAEKGDKPTLLDCLSGDESVNVNVTDLLGRTAVEIAVDNENVEIVEMLLQEEGILIGNALLCAIREGVYKLVEMLINHPSITPEMLGSGWTKSLDPAEAASAEYSSDISPVILAAHQSQFEILQLLLARGATIERPHSLSCNCKICGKEREYDSLHHSLKRINTYRALASPAWICLTSSDPILSTFRLSWDLERLALKEHEFKDTYMQLSEQCKTFACDLLSQCRSTEEVIAILNKQSGDNEYADLHASKLSLARLKLAIKYEQKQFVAHPHCQQLLTSIWYEGFPGRQERGSLMNNFVCFLLILLWPVLAICYVVMPKSRVGQIVRSPFMKFLYYSTSFGCFLVLLTMATFDEYRKHKGVPQHRDDERHNRSFDRGPAPTVVEWLIFIWVMGMVWSEAKQLWDEGFAKYVYQWWNWLDFIMMSLYLSTFALRACAYYLVCWSGAGDCGIPSTVGPYGPRLLARTEWNAYEPMLVAESLFAVANVFSFARIIYLFQTNQYLGPLQISLGCMLVDVLKFCFIFFLILSSFAIGLAQLYWYYDPSVTHPDCAIGINHSALLPDGSPASLSKHCDEAFSSIAASYTTLLWSLFSITDTKDTEVYAPHRFTEWVGRGMFIMYHVASIIVLLNMLIAMMSHSFQVINDHADLEWKFHRTKLWMAHFDEGSSLQPPFNLIVTPKSVFYFLRGSYYLVKWCCGKRQFHLTGGSNRGKRATIRRPGYHRELRQKRSSQPNPQQQLPLPPVASLTKMSSTDEPSYQLREPLTYHDIMKRLVSRFIHHTKKEMKMDGVNEDDLLEIKQDISSLRYELRDDRKKEIQRSSSHIDNVKRDIMRTLSFTAAKPNQYNTGTRRHSQIEELVLEADEDDTDEEPTYVDDSTADADIDCNDTRTTAASASSTAPRASFVDSSIKKIPLTRCTPDRPSLTNGGGGSGDNLLRMRPSAHASHSGDGSIGYTPFSSSTLRRARQLSALPGGRRSTATASSSVSSSPSDGTIAGTPCDDCCRLIRSEIRTALRDEFQLLMQQLKDRPPSWDTADRRGVRPKERTVMFEPTFC